MKNKIRAFLPFLVEIAHDFMLVACLLGPILIAALFRAGLPYLEHMLCSYFEKTTILFPYYIVFDLIVAVMTPTLFCFAGVMVILEEFDCGVAKYYGVTPLGRGGYLFSRIGIPSFLAFFYAVVILSFLNSSGISEILVILLSLSGTLMAVITSLFVVTFAKNKIEGMALVKLCGLFSIGIPAAYCISTPLRYFFGILPSFWMTELCITKNVFYFALILITAGITIAGLYRRFLKRLL